MIRSRSVIVVLLFLLASFPAVARESVLGSSRGEGVVREVPESVAKTIRQTYDKIAVYNRAARANAASDVADTLGLAFSIRMLDSGPIEAILGTSWRELVTLPSEDVIALATGALNEEGTQTVYYDAQWTPGVYSSVNAEDWSVSRVFSITPDAYAGLNRYTAYEVTVSFEGRSRTYRAMMLSGPNREPMFADDVVGLTGEVTRAWAEQRPAAMRQSLASDNREHGRMRVAANDTGESYFMFPFNYARTDHHEWGSHSAHAYEEEECRVLTDTHQICTVSFFGSSWTDTEGYSITANYYGYPAIPATWVHVGRVDLAPGQATGPRGSTVTCDGTIAVGFQECLINCSVNFSLGFSAPGVSGQVSVIGTNLPSYAYKYAASCEVKKDGEEYDDCGGMLVVVDNLPDWQATCDSPVVVDVEGDGFRLTSAQNGVAFDLNSDGTPDHLSWTAASSDDAFLALDRNGNGRIDDGRELFGNFTPQPATKGRNGFLALAEFDKSANGGNGDGVIDARDLIFASLVLWQDVNHDGVSQPDELHDAASLGITAIHVDYKESMRRDRYGNAFRYRAAVDSTRHTTIGRWAWDVFLVRES